MFGLSFEKIILIAIIAAVLIGPTKLPEYAQRLARFTRSVRDFAESAKVRAHEEIGADFDDIDWKKLDPRRYDPRRVIREALLGDDDSPSETGAARPGPTSQDDHGRQQDTSTLNPEKPEEAA